MSTAAPTPVTTPIPVQLSAPEFTAFILPHLSMPKRGPKCTLGYNRVFNLILWDSPPGCSGSACPFHMTRRANRPFTLRPSTKSLPNGRMMARSGRRLWLVCGISRLSSSSI
jgi:hypothetical protein